MSGRFAKALPPTELSPQETLRQELLASAQGHLFEVHHGPPSYWNHHWDEKLETYLAAIPKTTFATCPVCHHPVKAPQAPLSFNDPWWIYPQKSFSNSDTCPHFEFLTFTILWTHSEPVGAPWLIPCGWGIPALTEDLAQNENLLLSIKTQALPNGALIFWMTFYRQHAGVPLFSNFWPLPALKMRSHVRPNIASPGYWSDYFPITESNALLWSKIFIQQPNGSLVNYKGKKETTAWFQKMQTWNQWAYTQPLKMYEERFVTESGLASFSIGMRSSKVKGALFISQTPIFKSNTSEHASSSTVVTAAPHLQSLSSEQMKELAQTDSLWALVDPFQNETIQDWLRLIHKNQSTKIFQLWQDTEVAPSWQLAADSSHTESLKNQNLTNFYGNLSPLMIQVTPEVLELSYRYALGKQSWGAFFISSENPEKIHSYLRQLMVCNVHNQCVYFRYYESNFLSTALSVLKDDSLNYFYGPISAWIFRLPSENHHTLYSTTQRNPATFNSGGHYSLPPVLPKMIHEAAQRVFRLDLPRRLKDIIRERTPEFASVIPTPILDRWVRESIRQAQQWGLKKESHIIKFFLWKVLITPSWCHLPPFIKILQQKMSEESKVQTIENLLPQLNLAELPRGISIEAWDPELWNELRSIHSPLGHTDPEAFHPLLGEKPPLMPLHNPNWLRALGLFYESAYAELFSQSGLTLLTPGLYTDIQKLTHAPPRLLSIANNELIIREEGERALPWLKKHGFENYISHQGNWSHKTTNEKTILLLTRKFLEEFPYIDSPHIFDGLTAQDRQILTENLELFSIEWDGHHFWSLKVL